MRLHAQRDPLGQDLSVPGLLRSAETIREVHGKDALAQHLIRRIEAECAEYPAVVIAGMRSVSDHSALSHQYRERLVTVFVHSTPTARHARLDADPTSIAKGAEDYLLLDAAGEDEEIRLVALCADFNVVNDEGYPATLFEQSGILVRRIERFIKAGSTAQARKELIATMSSEEAPERGYEIHRLPVLSDGGGDDAPLPVRIVKSKGELTHISYDQDINYVAYVEFPLDGVPRANHFHEEKVEYMYLISGKLRGYYRLAVIPSAKVHEETIEAGSLVRVSPGWAHAYVTVEAGHAIEFSPSGFDVISKDKVRCVIID